MAERKRKVRPLDVRMAEKVDELERLDLQSKIQELKDKLPRRKRRKTTPLPRGRRR